MGEKILEVNHLSIQYVTKDLGVSRAVNDVSFSLNKGETLGLVGETGAGKTTIALGILRLTAKPQSRVSEGSILFEGQNLMDLKENEMRKIRGDKISMIFQDPMTSLNPIDVVGEQIAEVIWLHNKVSKLEARAKATEILEMVGIPAERYNEYPHQFSGGMKQRVVIAIALACNPDLLIADEPTTALDVTIQAQVLDMINKLKKDLNTSMILITHDLGVVAEMCDKVAIVYAGEIVEMGTARHIFKHAQHPYTKGLFGSLPNLSSKGNRLKPIRGMMPDPTDLPEGCKFHPRCDFCTEKCRKGAIPLVPVSEDGHMVRCQLAEKEDKA
ncbi:MAG: ABC transporter ATP-binding protein [Lachnospiraceae bacterium]|nr:ABC transporter ATP-binding protein [Lachnospiraceae bacterium]